jgi:hypothetical protein
MWVASMDHHLPVTGVPSLRIRLLGWAGAGSGAAGSGVAALGGGDAVAGAGKETPNWMA